MRIISLNEIRASVLKAIEEKGGDFVYQEADPSKGCVYFNEEGEKSCGIGWALVDLKLEDASKENIKRWRHLHGSGDPGASELFAQLANDDEDLIVTSHAKRWADTFQIHQDRGECWAKSARAADMKVGQEEYVNAGLRSSANTAEQFGGMYSTDEHSPDL